MLRSLRQRLRQLWEQCELFESLPTAPARVDASHDTQDVHHHDVHGDTHRRGADERVALGIHPKRHAPGHRPRSAWPPAPPRFVPPARTTSKSTRTRRPRVPRTNPEDQPFVERLTDAFHRYNAELFEGELHDVMIRVSRRMKNRLGHYMAATPSGLPAEIAISRRHIRRDSWDEVLHTLVHEMVHQWQDEKHLPIDHGAAFRRKAREVGISDRATRRVRPDDVA